MIWVERHTIRNENKQKYEWTKKCSDHINHWKEKGKKIRKTLWWQGTKCITHAMRLCSKTIETNTFFIGIRPPSSHFIGSFSSVLAFFVDQSWKFWPIDQKTFPLLFRAKKKNCAKLTLIYHQQQNNNLQKRLPIRVNNKKIIFQ